MDKNTLALTSGQAARYCFVTSDTILNWIKADCLPAQRTMGGQYRILVEDLRHFMQRHGMSTELLESEVETRSFCWEFHNSTEKKATATDMPCADCIVHKARAFNCFVIRMGNSQLDWMCGACTDCEYFQKWSTDDFQHPASESDAQALPIL